MILSVIGSAGSGKTMLSAKLAQLLEDTKQNVILVSSSISSPSVLQLGEKIPPKSLGALLEKPALHEEDILSSLLPLTHHTAVLSYLPGELSESYPEVTKSSVITLFTYLRHMADAVIIDHTAERQSVLESEALRLSDQVIFVQDVTKKGLGALLSMKQRMKLHPELSSITRFVVTEKHEIETAGDLASFFEKDTKVLPFTPELFEQSISLRLFEPLRAKSSRKTREILWSLLPSHLKEKKEMKKGSDLSEENKAAKRKQTEKRSFFALFQKKPPGDFHPLRPSKPAEGKRGEF